MPRPFGSAIELQDELRAKLESLARASHAAVAGFPLSHRLAGGRAGQPFQSGHRR